MQEMKFPLIHHELLYDVHVIIPWNQKQFTNLNFND